MRVNYPRTGTSYLTQGAVAGARDMAPVLLALAPVAVTLGASVSSAGVERWLAWLGGAIVYGASAHATAIALLGSGASGVAIVTAVLVLTSRGVIYSAGLMSRMQGQPAWFRWAGPYLLVDPLFALVTTKTSDRDSVGYIRWYYLGAGLAIWLTWLPALALGIWGGPVLPRNAGFDFGLTALLIAFLMPGLKSRPAVTAALVGAGVGIAGRGLPGGAGLLLATVAGSAVALTFEQRNTR